MRLFACWLVAVGSLPFAGLLASGCSPAAIEGQVLDVREEPLPGVAVTVDGTHNQSLTNALGRYTIAFAPGKVLLRFMKTGYTPGLLELTVNEARHVEATPVVLWHLPERAGVYLYEHHRYRDTYPLEPETFQTHNLGEVHGTTKWIDVETSNPRPEIVLYFPNRSIRDKIRLYLLALVDILPVKAGSPKTQEIWAPHETVSAVAAPIDRPDEMLLRLHFDAELSPGVYAVDLGALEGDTTIERRMFMFSVTDPPPPPDTQGGEPQVEVEQSGQGG
jgi:hypothetical protein